MSPPRTSLACACVWIAKSREIDRRQSEVRMELRKGGRVAVRHVLRRGVRGFWVH